MVCKRIFCLCLIFSFLNFSLYSQEVKFSLVNGDSIKGKIVLEDKDNYQVESPILGKIKIPKSAVMSIDSNKLPQVKRNPVEFKKEVSLGYSAWGGNTEKKQFNFLSFLNYKTSQDEWTAKLDLNYSSWQGTMDSQLWEMFLRYAFSFGPEKHWYQFFKLFSSHDRFANIDYRFIPSSGVGYWFSVVENNKKLVELALAWEQVKYETSGKNNFVSTILRFFLEKKINQVLFSMDSYLFTNMEELDDYRLSTELSLKFPINNQTSFRLRLKNNYHSKVTGEEKRYDYKYITELVYSF